MASAFCSKSRAHGVYRVRNRRKTGEVIDGVRHRLLEQFRKGRVPEIERAEAYLVADGCEVLELALRQIVDDCHPRASSYERFDEM